MNTSCFTIGSHAYCWLHAPSTAVSSCGQPCALEETLLVAVADAVAIATWRDAAVALDKNGAVSFHRGAADPCYEVVSVGGGAASIKCGPTDLLVAYADAVRIWAMAVDDKLGQGLLTPKASLQLDAAALLLYCCCALTSLQSPCGCFRFL